MPGKFILIDGNSLVHRAFYAIPMLSNSQGFITNAIYGFCNMLFRILEDEKPEYLAVAFDKGKIVFRHQDYEQYKATRKSTPDELRPQFPVLKDLLRAMNIALFECEGFEADDIIGTLAKLGETEQLEVLIVTGDRDSLQLLSPRTKVVLTRKGITELEKYDEQALLDKYGIAPAQMLDLKGLMGDNSDNIPGIPGVGEKTALKLIKEYGDLENVLAHYQDFTGKKLGQLLEQYADQARLSKKLAEIDRNVPLQFSSQECRVVEPDYPRLLEMLRELEFKNILQNMLERMEKTSSGSPKKAQLDKDGETIDDPGILEAYLKEKRFNHICIHLEFSQELGYSFQINQLGFKLAEDNPKEEKPVWLVWNRAKDLTDMLQVFKPYLESVEIKKTFHDAKQAIITFLANGIKLTGIENDTMLMGYLLNPSRAQTDLVSLARDYLSASIESSGGKEKAFLYLNAMSQLAGYFQQQLQEQEMWTLYHDVELPLTYVLAKMEKEGVLLDKNILGSMGNELDERIARLTEEIYSLAQEEFNINSPKQLGDILFAKLGLPKGKKTKTGYSTSADVLESLAAEHEIVAKILHYRQLVKIKTTYIDGLATLIDPETKRVHTSFNQTVTATGRLSSTEPNLQNIPIRMEEGRRLRKAFLPSPGRRLLTADYSQIELRVLAHMAQDELLIEAFHKGQDIHTRTAAEVFGVSMDSVSKEMRRAAKAVNFGIVYGISDYGLSQDLGITRSEAKEYITNYFLRYRGVKQYIDRIIEEARYNGYVTTLLNRRRYLPDILSRNFHLRSFAERTAMNTPIQGSAADIIKLAMLKMQQILVQEEYKSTMILQVHDELIFDVPEPELDKLAHVVDDVMSSVYELSVPLKVDLQTGPNWYALELYQV